MARADPDARAGWPVATPVELVRGGPHNDRQAAIAYEVADSSYGVVQFADLGLADWQL